MIMAQSSSDVASFSNVTSSSNKASSSGMASSCALDKISYLKIEIPHLRGRHFSFLGPFRSREATIPFIRSKLREISPAGLLPFEVLVSADGPGLPTFDKFDSPLEEGFTMTIRLIEERNPVVLANLPGPVWMVMHGSLRSSRPRVMHDVNIRSTHTSLEAANLAAHEIVMAKSREPGHVSFKLLREPDGTMLAFVFGIWEQWVIDAKYQSAEELSEKRIGPPGF